MRKKQKDSKVDTELVYAYAKTGQMGPLEEFISGTHQVRPDCGTILCVGTGCPACDVCAQSAGAPGMLCVDAAFAGAALPPVISCSLCGQQRSGKAAFSIPFPPADFSLHVHPHSDM